MLYEVKRYTDDDGRQVTAKMPLNIKEGIIEIKYSGTVGIKTPMGTVPFGFDFPDGFNLEQAFSKFDDVLHEEIKKVQDANRIVTPGGTPAQGPKLIV